jgi:hypothetical protein
VNRAPSLAAALAVALAGGPAAAQAVHFVGPGGFASLQAAIDAAAPGDVVRVAAGVHPPFRVAKALTIAAEPSALVQIVGSGAVSIALQPADRVHLGGLDADVGGVVIDGGAVSMERCTLRTVRGVRVLGAMLAMRWCAAGAVHGNGVALENAHLHASDSTFSTAAGGTTTIEHGAVRVDGDGTLQLATCTLVGAWPGRAHAAWPSAALHVSRAAPGARSWLVDCVLHGGFHASGPQGPSVVARTAPPARLRVYRCTLNGLALGAIATGNVVGLTSPPDLQLGSTFTTTMRGDPGRALLFYFGTNVLGQFPIAETEQNALGFVGLEVIATRVADAQGRADFTFVVPNDPALRHSVLWWRGLDVSVVPWQATPAFATIAQ